MCSPYVGAGMEMLQCPISYGFYEDADLTPSVSGLLIDAFNDRKAGIVPPWGEGSALYHNAIGGMIPSLVREREAEQIKAIKAKQETIPTGK